MQKLIKRYNLNKELIATGILTITGENQTTYLNYVDSEIEESVSELYHPLMALEKLRRILEDKHGSIIGCIGCRIDSAYKASGGYGTFMILAGGESANIVNLFDPTDEIEKLCTVDEHKAAYEKWGKEIFRKKN